MIETPSPDSTTQDTGAKFHQFLNITYGVMGRTVSTRFEPNTSGEFQFWLSKLIPQPGGESESSPTIAPIEIGNIIAAYSDQKDDVTFGIVTEMRSYSDVESFIADYLSHDFGDATIEVPTDISEVTVVNCAVMRNVSLKTKPVGRSRVYFLANLASNLLTELWMKKETSFSVVPLSLLGFLKMAMGQLFQLV